MHAANDDTTVHHTSTAPPALASASASATRGEDDDGDRSTVADLRQRLQDARLHLTHVRVAVLEAQVHYHETLFVLEELRWQFDASHEAEQ